MWTFKLKQRKFFSPKFYRKAPVAALLLKIKKLKQLSQLAFLFALLLIVLSNPFASINFFKNLTEQNWSLEEGKKVLTSIPEFLKVLPKEFEKNTFSFFDWSSYQLDNLPVFAKESSLAVEEAGPSAAATEVVTPTPTPTPDPASLSYHIEIKKLDLYQKVSPNVDANDESEYSVALEEGVAHAKGSAFPGQNKMVYIFGHSTDSIWNVATYNAVFYQVKDLVADDVITLYHGEKLYHYKVINKEVIQSTDVDFVNNKINQDILLLQTCWPPGTSWQRIFVTAIPISTDEAEALLEAQGLLVEQTEEIVLE